MEKIKITVNGKEIFGKSGDTVLNIAAENGIEIPNLCHSKELKSFGACGICLAEEEGNKKLIRTCSAEAYDGMIINTETERVKRARSAALELIMSDHEGDCVGPCSLNCPAHTDVQGYLKKNCRRKRFRSGGNNQEKNPDPGFHRKDMSSSLRGKLQKKACGRAAFDSISQSFCGG